MELFKGLQKLCLTYVERFSSLPQISKLSVAKSRSAGEGVVSLCYLRGTASDAVDAVKLEIPQGFRILKFNMSEYLKIIVKLTISKILNTQLRSYITALIN